jgi:hypothetical protein
MIQLQALNATLQQKIRTDKGRDKQIADLQNALTRIRLNATTPTETKLVASDGAAYAYFGAVAATDGMVVVGAYGGNNETNYGTGSAYVFAKNSTGQFEQVSKLMASDGAQDDLFGRAVAATDGMAMVGAPGNDNGRGSLYVFAKNSTGQFEQVSKLVASDGAAYDSFGCAVAVIDGNTVVVGAYSDRTNETNVYGTGSVYVFAKNSTGQFEQVSKLVASDGADEAYFGSAVAATDGMVVVGAYGDGNNETHFGAGSVYVFAKNSTGQFEQVSKLDGAGHGGRFGSAVAATDGMVMVGAPDDQHGALYVFAKNSTGQYEQVNKLVASDGAVDDSFGRSLAATDGMVVAGAYAAGFPLNGNSTDSVYVFAKNSTGQFEQVSKLMASDGAQDDLFGSDVAVTGSMVVVGAPCDRTNETLLCVGSVYVIT